MKIILRNRELSAALSFVGNMNLEAASASRHRSKFKNALIDAIDGLKEAESEIYDKYGEKDENGKLIINDARTDYKIRDGAKTDFYQEMAELLNEEVIIEGGIYIRNISRFGQVLAEYNGVISGKEADIYDRLMDEFEKEENQDVKD
ncbi:DUF1617 family protein [Enterococcus casseliflavus]|uniref:DUF1617 family protein n=1 Tax=Enterococcus casseliflavus TaxID=37734 RepID=A0A415ENL8_ENTCA|nr:DUF1617 family protein [Enterococcus casseliflavus]